MMTLLLCAGMFVNNDFATAIAKAQTWAEREE
jgi:hypothetical protein